MYQSKSRRKLFQVDMFPMFNLLLIILFFLLIAGKPREQSPINIDLPTGHSFNRIDPDGGNITILQGQGKIMLKTDYEDVRKEALILMGNIYHLTFSPAELLKFSKINT